MHQRLHGHCHAEIGLAGTRGANAEDDVALLNHFDVLALHRGFRGNLFFAGRTKTRAGEVIAQAVRAILGDLRKSFAQFFVGELAPFGKESREVFQDTFDRLDVFGITVNGQTMTASVDLNGEQRLEVLDVLVVNAEKRLQASWWKLDFLQMLNLSP